MAAKGKQFEHDLEIFHKELAKQGLADIRHHHPPMKRVRGQWMPVGKAACDFGGPLLNLPSVSFDAKEVHGTRMAFKGIPAHQALHLGMTNSLGHVGFLAIRFVVDGDAHDFVLHWAEVKDDYWRWADEGGRPASITWNDPRLIRMNLRQEGWHNIVMAKLQRRGHGN